MKRKLQPKYEGKQYRGGRGKGSKNLKRTETGFINQHGIEFTIEERKALESAVNSANRRRKQMLELEAKLPRKSRGKDTGQTVQGLQLMGRESDFILTRKTKSLQRFKSHEEYENYLRNLRRVNSPGYIDIRVKQYKDNYKLALQNVFGADADEIIAKVDKMSNKDYMRTVQSSEELEIWYIYSLEEYNHKLSIIRESFGLSDE